MLEICKAPSKKNRCVPSTKNASNAERTNVETAAAVQRNATGCPRGKFRIESYETEGWRTRRFLKVFYFMCKEQRNKLKIVVEHLDSDWKLRQIMT